MERCTIAHYKKQGSSMYVNGGTLTVTDTDCIIEYMKREIARFSMKETRAEIAPSELLYEGIRLSDGRHSIDIYFQKGSKSIKAVREHFNI